MANFLQLPVVSESDMIITDTQSGIPFSNNSVFVGGSVQEGGVYAATDNGDVYAANVAGKLAFLCIGSGYNGIVWQKPSPVTVSYSVQSTDYSSVYAINTNYFSANLMNTTVFPNLVSAVEMFYNEFVEVDYNGIVVSVTGYPENPMDEGGTSNPEIPEGEFNPDTTPIDIPSLPPISAAESGLVSLFRPDLAQLQALGRYLWTNIADVPDNLKKLISNPMDCLIALNIVPCIPDVGEVRAVKLGFWETGAQMPPVLSQWYSFYCGGVKIPLYSGTYLDYSPNTKITLMLPFIGSVPLNTDEVMNRTIGVTYHIDLLSGQCVSLVTVDESVYYQFTGECAVSVPLTGADYSRIYTAAVGTLGALITGGLGAVSLGRAAGTAIGASSAAAEAAGSVAAAGQAFADVNATSKGIAGVAAMRQNLITAQDIAINAGRAAANAPAQVAKGIRAARIANTLDNAVSSVMGAKQMVSHSGNLSGAAGMLGVRTPFVTIEYPNQSLPQNYKHFTGYPSNIYARLGTLSGYTECEQVLIENCPCTDDEMSEILEALKGGVYL